jgi:hypothetical protein
MAESVQILLRSDEMLDPSAIVVFSKGRILNPVAGSCCMHICKVSRRAAIARHPLLA